MTTARSQSEAEKLALKTPNSARAGREIEKLIPGGVNSPFRSFHEVGGQAIFMKRGRGSRIYDIDGNSYIDYVGAWGPAILGHAPDHYITAIKATLDEGPLFGAPHELELELAERIINSVESIEKIRFVNSGTEAVMSSIRLARGFTGKDLIVTFEGCYHGHSDATLANRETSHSAGVPKDCAKNTISARFNDLDHLDALMEKHQQEVAAVILEPVAGSMGVVPPQPGYLEGVKFLCIKYGALLIFDEVLTGFRVAYGGAQSLYGIVPDLTCYGKALAGGMPIGAYGGRQDIMNHLAPVGNVYQAGTFSGNPVTMSGGIAILESLSDKSVYQILEDRTKQLFDGLQTVIDDLNEKNDTPVPVQLQRVGSMFGILFSDRRVRNFKDSQHISETTFARFFHLILEDGIYLPPTAVDAACVSIAHSPEDIDATIDSMSRALRSIFA
ncbi:MAG: glutamate-1-semialdehyde 2,1-aminomutase [Candidatus Obscuribacterales bacterium]|nr:glutamate-1-semialdehyde 2,1-aminomutase [Candidatus Obscuribacterales bacterium]